MPQFEEALKATLLGMNDAFGQADADLHRAVASADQVVGRVSDGAANLRLWKHEENTGGVIYRLALVSADKRIKIQPVLGAFLVRSQGYPVLAAPDEESLRTPEGVQLKDNGQINNYLAEMAANPDSPLVQHLAFFMRRRRSANGESGDKQAG